MKLFGKPKLKMAFAAVALMLGLPFFVGASGDILKDVNRNDKNRFDKPCVVTDTVSRLNQVMIKRDAAANADDAEQHEVNGSQQSAPQADAEIFTVNGVSFEMIHVDGGTFTMGATPEQGDDAINWEFPAHEVCVSDFSIGKTEVTQELWEAVMGYNPSRFTATQRPVETVSWDDCHAFVFRLRELTGRRFRLPTEAEWEYAARGGSQSQGYKYAGSNDINSVAWYYDNSNGATHPVGLKQPNELGLFDMNGNVMEWCQDCHANYNNYSDGIAYNPWGSDDLYFKAIRGGNFKSNNRDCRVSSRSNYYREVREDYHGLRLAISELSGQNISFMHEQQQITSYDRDCVVPVAITRADAHGTYTARVMLGTPRSDNVTLLDQFVYFADGEKTAYTQVRFNDMVMGNEYECTLCLSEADAATTNPEYGKQILTTSILVRCDYNWISLGNGWYSSPEWWEDSFYVPIERAEGSNVYRMIGLFESGFNIQFTINSDNSVYVPAQPSWWHSSYGYIYLVGDANGTSDSYAGTYDTATKTITFNLLHYVPGVGAFGTFVDTLIMP